VAFSSSNGPPVVGPGPRVLKTVDLMRDPGTQLSSGQAFLRGVATAHRGINYVHTDFRSHGSNRSSGMGKVSR
jgi:hypothetical protein